MANTNLVLVHNAKIWSGSVGSDYDWMVFDSTTGYITDCGTGDIPREISRKKDCSGKRIFPGFHESHVHLGHLGETLYNLDLHGCNSIASLKRKLISFAEEHPTGWIIGNNWEHDILGRYPTKEDLDEVCCDRPVFMNRICHHIAVANSKALELSGIDKDMQDPEGGAIDHYPSDHPLAGELTGIVRETARAMITPFFKPSSVEVIFHLKVALKQCLENGVTSAHSCEIESWNEFQTLAKTHELPIRIFYSAFYTSRDSGNFPRANEKFNDLLSCDRIKLFSDGALGVGTALLSQPYRGKKDYGIPIHSQTELLRQVKEATAAGYRLEVHAIGDGAAEMVIKAMEDAQVTPEKRPILTHCQILRHDLIPRMKALGMIANIQPQFVPTDARWIRDFLPDSLMGCCYAWKTLMDAGVVCAGGSDSPVEPASPLLGIYDAIFRPSGRDEPWASIPFIPEEKLSVTEAIDLYTKNGAYTTMEEHRLGQIRPGYFADFVIIDSEKDVVDFPECFKSAKVSEVFVAGEQRR